MKKYIILILLIAIYSCSSYSPFESRKQKKQAKYIIKNNLNTNYSKIIKDDSIFLETFISLNKTFKDSTKKTKFNLLVKRRVDSFYLKSYIRKELLILLKMDRELFKHGIIFEPIRNNKNIKYAEINSVNDVKNFMLKEKEETKAVIKALDSSKNISIIKSN